MTRSPERSSISWLTRTTGRLEAQTPPPRLGTWMTTLALLVGMMPLFFLPIAGFLIVLFMVASPASCVQFLSETTWDGFLDGAWIPASGIVALLLMWARARWFSPAELRVRANEIEVFGARGIERLPVHTLVSVTPTWNGWSLNRLNGASIRIATSASRQDGQLVFEEIQRLAETAIPSNLPPLERAWQELDDRKLPWMDTTVDDIVFRLAPSSILEVWKVLSIVLATLVLLPTFLFFMVLVGEGCHNPRVPQWSSVLEGALVVARIYGFWFLFEYVRQWFNSAPTLRVRAHHLEVERRGRVVRMALRDLATIEQTRLGWRITSTTGERTHVFTSAEPKEAALIFLWLERLGDRARQLGSEQEVPTSIEVLQGRSSSRRVAAKPVSPERR